MAGQAAAVQYEIVKTTTVSEGFVGINNHGDLLMRTGAYTDYALEHDGVITPIPTTTGSASYPNGSILYDISDSGVAFGAAYDSWGRSANAAVWSVANGWQVMPWRRLSEVAGITGDGRCLVRSGSWYSSMDEAYWWRPGSDPVLLPLGYIGRSDGCDLAGNMLINDNGASKIVTPTLEQHFLTMGNVHARSYFITPGGIACGQSDSGSTLFWNTSGQIIESTYSSGWQMFRCNESRIGVGWFPTPNRALYYSSATGALNLDSLLTSQFSGWTLTKSYDINDSGQILAQGRAPGSTVDSWCLLNPVPEPSTWLAMGLGTSCLLLRRRRRSPCSG